MAYQLPNEIWKIIFKCLPERDLTTCSVVCKVWRHVIHSFKALHVHCSSLELRSLLQDLGQFNTLGLAITHLSLSGSDCLSTEAIWLESILSYCTHLITLQLEQQNAPYYLCYLSPLTLPSLQQIQVHHLCQSSPATQSLLIEWSYHFRHSLTHLELVQIDTHHTLSCQSSLLDYLKAFPCLRTLKASTQSTARSAPIFRLDLASLLSTVPHLTSLSLTGYSLLIHASTLSSDPQLMTLELKETHISLSSLHWLTNQLPALKQLTVDQSIILPTEGEQEEEAILQHFLSHLIQTRLHQYDLIHFREWTFWIGLENHQSLSPVFKGRFLPSLLYESMDPNDPLFLTDRIRLF